MLIRSDSITAMAFSPRIESSRAIHQRGRVAGKAADDEDDDDDDEKEDDDEGGDGECDDDEEGGGYDDDNPGDHPPAKPKRKADNVKRTKEKPAKNKPDDDGTGGRKKNAAEFEQAIAAKMTQGLRRDQAARAVVHERPRLHERLVTAFNRTQRPRTDRSLSSKPSDELATLQRLWEQHVREKMATGLPRMRAVAAAARDFPTVRQALIAAANPHK